MRALPHLFVAGALAALVSACSSPQAEAPAATGPSLIDVLRERILAEIALTPGMAVAEIGVGGGWFVTRVAEAVGPGGVVYGTDIDPEAIAALHRKVPDFRPGAGRVDLRLCRDGRDTALDDLAEGRLDLILMVDSLCFDAQEPRERNVAYLRNFLRVLRPGGRFVHHMDCRCNIAPEAVVALFIDAGFSRRVESIEITAAPALIEPDWPCRTDAERRRHAFLAVFRKPSAPSDAAAGRGSAGP